LSIVFKEKTDHFGGLSGQILLGIVLWCSFIASTRKRALNPARMAKSAAIGRKPFA
jgi:hypothetical protein